MVASAQQKNLLCKDREKRRKKSLIICSKCKQEIGPGIAHKCSIALSSGHIVDQIQTLPERQQQQIISSLLKAKIQGAEGDKRE